MLPQVAISTILLLVWVSSSPYAHAQDYAQVACGGRPNMKNGCQPVVTDTVLKTDLYGVRCCSSASFPHAKKQAQCDVWAIARTPTVKCNTAATYEEALAHCNDLGAERLCTVDELLDKCAKSTGCGLNKKLVWSLPSTASPTQSPVSLPVPLTASPTKAPVSLPLPLVTASPISSPVSLPVPPALCSQISSPITCMDTEGCEWFASSCGVCSINSCSTCNKSKSCTDAGCNWSKGNCIV